MQAKMHTGAADGRGNQPVTERDYFHFCQKSEEISNQAFSKEASSWRAIYKVNQLAKLIRTLLFFISLECYDDGALDDQLPPPTE